MTPEQRIEAIQALLNGEYDNQQLLKIGMLWSGPNHFKANVEKIINYGN